MTDHPVIRESTPEERCYFCAKYDRLRDLKALFKKGAEHPEIDARRADNLETPLFAAVDRGSGRCAMFLLSKGADPNVASMTGETPLHRIAAQGSRLDLALALIEAGANPSAACKRGETPLHVAAGAGNAALAEALLAKGSDPLALDSDGNTPLDRANRSLGNLDSDGNTLFARLAKSLGSGEWRKAKTLLTAATESRLLALATPAPSQPKARASARSL